MKKINLSGMFMLTVATVFFACSTDDDPNKAESDKLSFESFKKYGDYHNLFLSNFRDNFMSTPDIKQLGEGIDYINSFNKEFVNQLDLSRLEKEVLKSSLDRTKHFVNPPALFDACYSEPAKSPDGSPAGNLFTNIESSLVKGYIDQFEYQKLTLIGEKIKDNYYGIINDAELESIVMQVRSEWIEQGYSETSKYGRTLAIALSISISSMDWWKENQDAIHSDGSDAKVAAWVAADIVGACYGAVVSGIGSYATQGEVNWGAVGISAVGGAVAGSTGGIGKAAKFLKSLF